MVNCKIRYYEIITGAMLQYSALAKIGAAAIDGTIHLKEMPQYT
jgi:hypothetical protein